MAKGPLLGSELTWKLSSTVRIARGGCAFCLMCGVAERWVASDCGGDIDEGQDDVKRDASRPVALGMRMMSSVSKVRASIT